MSHMNYNKMYDADKEQKVVEPVAEPVVESAVEVEPIAESVAPVAPVVEPEKPEVPETHKAIVCNCAKLNVRKNPYSDADVLAIIDLNDIVEVLNADAKGKFYPVRTASGVEGYCVKDYLKMK